MRIRILLLTLLTYDVSVQAELPADAAKLRQSYTDACEKAVKPLTEKYVTELEKLLATHTKAGNLEAALAIKEELTKFKQPDVQLADAPSDVAGETGRSRKLYRELAGSSWNTDWFAMTLTLTAEGTILFSSPRAGVGWKWKASDDGELLISQSAETGFRNAKLNDRENSFVIPFGSEEAKVCTRKLQP